MSETDTPELGSTTSGGILARLLDRGDALAQTDSDRANAAVQSLLVIAFAITGAYTVFFAFYDLAALGPVVVAGVIAVMIFAVGLAFSRTGHQLIASIIGVTAAAAQVTFVTAYIGWASGVQLFLIAGGQLVFMVFTERQRVLRWVYLLFAVGAFIYCQMVAPERGDGYTFPASANGALFTANATMTLLLMYTLAAVSHYSAARARAEANQAAARAEYLANTDALTGLANRRPVMRRLDELDSPYSLAIADLDHFKALNDTFGHECGDRVLAAIGQRLRVGLRTTDMVGRWGGEEFIFVMAGTSIDDAVAMMERMRTDLEQAPVACWGHGHDVTMSIGITDALPTAVAHRALQRADAALYEAKGAGRNVVRTAPGPRPTEELPTVQRRRRA